MPENIYVKVAKIARGCGVMQKNGKGFNYKYTTEDEVLAAVTGLMKKYNVSLVPNIVPNTLHIQPVSYSKYDKKAQREVPVNEVIVSAEAVFTWVNLEDTSDKLAVPWIICGSQEDVSQAFGGALTYANRYFLLKSLQMATVEDDPDNYRTKQKQSQLNDVDEELVEKRNLVLNLAKTMVKNGIDKTELYDIIKTHNEGSNNPNSIKSVEIANQIIAEFNKIADEKKGNK